MPARKAKVLGQKQAFIQYSIDAHKSAYNYGKKQATEASEAAWKEVSNENKKKFHKAYTAKEAAKAEVEEGKKLVKDAKKKQDKIIAKPADQKIWKDVVDAWAEWYARQSEVVDLCDRWNQRSREFVNLVDQIYPDDRMKHFAAQKRDEAIAAKAQAELDRNAIAAGEGDLHLPTTSNGEIKVPEDWIPQLKEDTRAEWLGERFLHSGLHMHGIDEKQWTGAWPVGGGGHSRTGVFVKVDESGNIQDRVLRKDTYLQPHQFADMTLWDYQTTLRNDVNNLWPMEASCNRSLQRIKTQRLGQEVGVSIFRTGWVQVGFRYTMYLRYCTRRDLNNLIKMYHEHGDKAATPYIPEAFLWRVFLSLAVTGLVMQKGSADPTNEPNDEWTREIVHRDLKPSNIFLDEPTEDHFQSYPTPRMGDFGISVKTHKDDILNPEIFHHYRGTKGFEPPEQAPYKDLRNAKRIIQPKQLAASNVYGAGMIMLALMTLRRSFEARQWLGAGEQDTHMVDSADWRDATSNYTESLRALVQSCIQYHIEQRPTFEEMLDQIESVIMDMEFKVVDDDTDQNVVLERYRSGDIEVDGTYDSEDVMCEKHIYASALTVAQMGPRA